MKKANVLRVLAAVLLVVSLFPRIAAAQFPYDSLYAFGDSLADNGNLLVATRALGIAPPVPPSTSPHRTYYNGRFSNGPVAFEYLWALISGHAPESPGGLKAFLAAPILGPTGAVDFAFGGTGTPLIDQTPGGFWAPGLKGQVELFRLALRGRKPSKHALYAIVTGFNDYRVDQFNQPMAPADVVRNIVDSVKTLYDIGARDVMVLNLPDLGLLPAGIPGGSALSTLHNALLAAALTQLSVKVPQLRVIQADFNQALGLVPVGTNVTTPALDVFFPPAILPPGFKMSLCLFIDPRTCANVPTFQTPGPYLFWDAIHPTTDAHQILGLYLYSKLQ